MDRLKKTTGKISGLFRTAGTKHGTYSVGLTVIVIAVVIVLNLVIGQIPEAYRNLDVSSTKIYEITDTTKELLGGLEDEVDMKVLAVKDETDDRIVTFLSRYASLSGKIHLCNRTCTRSKRKAKQPGDKCIFHDIFLLYCITDAK